MKKSGISNAFREESDDDSCGTLNYSDVGRVNSLLTQRSVAAEKQANKIHSDALAEDPSAFDYDDSYDTFKVPDVKSHSLSQPNTKEDGPVSQLYNELIPPKIWIKLNPFSITISAESKVHQQFNDNSKRPWEGER